MVGPLSPPPEMDLDTKVWFSRVLDDAKRKYESRISRKGDSWKRLSLYDLRVMLKAEYREWVRHAGFNIVRDERVDKINAGSAEYDELKDILNHTLMLMARIRGPSNV